MSLEWDRGHEKFDAILRLIGVEGIVVSQVHDYWPLAGCRWIRRSEIIELEPLDADDPTLKVLDRLGVRFFGVDPSLTSLDSVLRHAAETPMPIGVYSRRTGSGEVLVGVVSTVDGGLCVVRDVDTDGTFTGEDLTYDIADIISVEWATDYLTALEILLGD